MAAELLVKDAIADRFGVDLRTVSRWVQEGMPQRQRHGRLVFSWPDCYRWREEQIRQDGRAARLDDRMSGGDEEMRKQFADARLRTALAEAEEAELNVAHRRGDMVLLDDMAAEFDRVCQSLRTALLALPQVWEPRLAACVTTTDRQVAIRGAVDELLSIVQGLAVSGAKAPGSQRALAG